MKRVVISIVVTVTSLIGLSASPAAAEWACIGIDHVDLGVCLDDPLPERLPLP